MSFSPAMDTSRENPRPFGPATERSSRAMMTPPAPEYSLSSTVTVPVNVCSNDGLSEGVAPSVILTLSLVVVVTSLMSTWT